MRRDPGSLASGVFDLFIIGGGCSGAGVALDAASRGLRVAIVDKGDWASATSSASSKLVHGGLRYLEYGQLGLVYESLAERRRLLLNAPHLVRPLRFVLPFYRRSRMSAWKGRVGLWMYDLLAGPHNLGGSRRVSPLQLCKAFPALRSRGLIGAAEYYDAQMDDARLGLEIVRTAVSFGANASNYVEVIGFDGPGRVQVRDVLTGTMLTVQARQVLNATGPWVDAVMRLAGESKQPPQLEPTKGVHIIIAGTTYADGGEPRSRETAFTLLHPADGRVFFVLPWMGHTLIGTTDTFTTESADALRVTAGEEQYLLDGYNEYFGPSLTRGDVRGRFAGLRPLLRSDPANPSARSREFRLIDGPNGLLSAAGGKWTTYRSMAETITDAVCERLGHRVRCRTRNLKLDGTPRVSWPHFVATEPAAIAERFGLSLDAALHLVHRYGRRASEAAAAVAASADGRQPIVSGEPDLHGEWAYQHAAEMALTRADHLLRRSRVGMWHEELLADGQR